MEAIPLVAQEAPVPVPESPVASGESASAPAAVSAEAAEPSQRPPERGLAPGVGRRAATISRRGATWLRAAAALIAVVALGAAVRSLILSRVPRTLGPTSETPLVPTGRERATPTPSATSAERQSEVEPSEAPPFAALAPEAQVAAQPAASAPPGRPSLEVAHTPRPTLPIAAPAPPVLAKPAPASRPSAESVPPPVLPGSLPAPPALEGSLPQLADLLAMGDGALGERRFDEALRLFDEVLRLEPGNSRAREGKAHASQRRDLARRSFVSGRTLVLTGETDKSPQGFQSEGLRVLKTPRYSGRINFQVSPRSPRPGESISWQAHLTNDGKRKFKIASVAVKRTLNGTNAEESSKPDRELDPGESMLLKEATEVWQEETSSWSLEVAIVTHGQETFRGRLRWE